MRCPSCGNYAKPEIEIFFSFNVLKFKCRMCNEWIRGNLTMLILDLLSIALYVAFALALFVFREDMAVMFGEWSFPLFGILGILAVRVPIVWLICRLGKFQSA